MKKKIEKKLKAMKAARKSPAQKQKMYAATVANMKGETTMITEIKEKTFVYEGTVYTVADIKHAIDKIGMSDIPAVGILDMLREFLEGFYIEKWGEGSTIYRNFGFGLVHNYMIRDLIHDLWIIDEPGHFSIRCEPDLYKDGAPVGDGDKKISIQREWHEAPTTEDLEDYWGDDPDYECGHDCREQYDIGVYHRDTGILEINPKHWYPRLSNRLTEALAKVKAMNGKEVK